eukprot:14276736-Ditylum_brightwellii.AAC.1
MPFPQQQNRQNHHNCQTHDNSNYPNFEPTVKGFEKERKGRAVKHITINKMVKKALHHGQCATRKQRRLTETAAISRNIYFWGDLQIL